VRRELGDALGIQRCTLGLADSRAQARRPPTAHGLSRRDGRPRARVGRPRRPAACLRVARRPRRAGGRRARRARRCAATPERLRVDIGYVPPQAIATRASSRSGGDAAAVGDDAAFERAYAAGLALSSDAAIALALPSSG
jgi:hypothetical protein